MDGADLRWMWLDEAGSYERVVTMLLSRGTDSEYGIRPLESIPAATAADWS